MPCGHCLAEEVCQPARLERQPEPAVQNHDQGGFPAIEEPFVRQLHEAWVLYYPLADRLLILNPTAKLVWELVRQGHEEHEIASAFACHFGIAGEQAARDVSRVLAELTDGRTQGDQDEVLAWGLAGPSRDAPVGDQSRPTECGVFRFGQIRLRVHSSVSQAGVSLFARFQHRASRGDGGEVLELAKSDSGYRLTLAGSLIAETTALLPFLSRLVELLLTLEHPQQRVLAYCHAAAVSRRGRSLLLPGSSGVGKSTLTAFLAANGFVYVGDDTIAIGEEDFSLLPLPTCLSLKSGSWRVLEPLYPALANLPTMNRFGRTIRYVDPYQNYQAVASTMAPAAIVFPAYATGEPTRLSSLSPTETMIRLVGAHARLATPATEARLAQLIRFVEQTPAYELTYCELPGALQAIEDLLASRR